MVSTRWKLPYDPAIGAVAKRQHNLGAIGNTAVIKIGIFDILTIDGKLDIINL
jgi:hypothetical protein